MCAVLADGCDVLCRTGSGDVGHSGSVVGGRAPYERLAARFADDLYLSHGMKDSMNSAHPFYQPKNIKKLNIIIPTLNEVDNVVH